MTSMRPAGRAVRLAEEPAERHGAGRAVRLAEEPAERHGAGRAARLAEGQAERHEAERAALPVPEQAAKLGSVALLLCAALSAYNVGGRAEYVGGTITQIPAGCHGRVQAIDDKFFVFYAGKASWRVPYEKINLVEYGEKVDRRYLAAVLLSPLFLLAKKRQHFLTIGYSDEEDRQQAMIFKINKDDIRTTLVVLEARTGRKVEYQDDDARKSGKG